MENIIIYLLGFPGTGKRTIAKEICAQDKVILIDNQTINIPIFTAVDADGKTKLPDRVWDNTKQIWNAVFDTMVHIAPPEKSYVLTNVLLNEDKGDRAWFSHVQSIAEQKGATFVPVRLTCSVEEMTKRIVRLDRKALMKETDPASPAKYMAEFTVFNPDHRNTLDLDVTELEPAEAARIILRHARSLIL